MTILSVLAPVLAAGLALFVAALPFTGLEPLWDRTSATTPTLIACIVGAILLANAVIGNDRAEESGNRLLRGSACVLCLVLLPLAIVALVSTWLRVDQHGFTPQRLWGLVVVGAALVIAAAYLLAVALGRRGWMATLRSVNVGLALFVCGVAFLLATPLSDFGGMSARDQIARLRSGAVPADRFDWDALAFDFGPSGREALAHLAREGWSEDIREQAKRALAKDRWQRSPRVSNVGEEVGEPLITIRPATVALPEALRQAVTGRGVDPGICVGSARCTIFWSPGERSAVVIADPCEEDRAAARADQCPLLPVVLRQQGGIWMRPDLATPEVRGVASAQEHQQRLRAGIARGEVSVREVPRRQLFIGEEPVGSTFE